MRRAGVKFDAYGGSGMQGWNAGSAAAELLTCHHFPVSVLLCGEKKDVFVMLELIAQHSGLSEGYRRMEGGRAAWAVRGFKLESRGSSTGAGARAVFDAAGGCRLRLPPT